MNQMLLNYPKCECHDCTQARWKMSFQGQSTTNLTPQQYVNSTTAQAVDQYIAGYKVGTVG